MFDAIEQLRSQAQADLKAVDSAQALEQFRIKYLGSKGALKTVMSTLKGLPADQRPQFGQHANQLRDEIQQAFDQKKSEMATHAPAGPGSAAHPTGVDVTEPGTDSPLGRTHVITQTIDQLIDMFGRMGFSVATGPEVEDDHHNFVALNIPPHHPARDPLDNFYLHDPPGSSPTPETGPSPERRTETGSRGGSGGNASPQLLRSQTSTVQIRVMESTQPPIRVIAPGRVYRPDEHDATHSSMFHQIEGLYVDRHVTMADLKTTLIQFAHAFFGPEAEVRLRPSYFPFTEPSAELDIKMQIRGQWTWVEVGGCGMVDPAVFNAVGYDPEVWTGFAFGLGIERLTMRKYSIPDIRWFYENDLRFLRQF